MVPSDLFRSFGGFDAIYKPAYYEDTDLAFKLRQAGRRVYYQPLSVIVHHEGVSSGTDVKSGVKRYQARNNRLFFDRWKHALAGHRLNGEAPHLEKDRGIIGRALYVDETTPTPQEDAGSNVAISHMRILQELGYHVTFVPADNMANLGGITRDLQRMGMECLYAPYYWSLEEVLRKRGEEFDLVYLHRYINAFKYLAVLRSLAPRAKILHCVADLHSLRLERQAGIANTAEIQAEAARVRAREYQAIRDADCTIVHSKVEADLLRRELPDANVALIPWVVEPMPAPTPFGERKNIAFIGGYRHPPNVDAVEFFAGEVLPPLLQLIPDVKLLVIGSNMPESVRRLAGPHVEVLGFIPDLKPVLAGLKLTVAPMRYGAGIKGKILASLAHGVPCVANSLSAEGMGLTDGVDIGIAEAPNAIAAAIAELYCDEALWRARSEAGLRYIQAGFAMPAVMAKMRNVVTGFGLPVAAQA
jgi:glycosyltransferase involved in cell wall biosynthesis